MAIQSFRDRKTRQIFEGKGKKLLGTVARSAERKLTLLQAAVTLEALRSPPGNRLEALEGDREGQHSIRINDQYRICFRWTDAGPEDVEVTDYH
jgi:proteic killer suppression protein